MLLNTDGAAKKETGMTGCGGLLRDSNGRWVVRFAKNLGNTNAYMADLWGLYEGSAKAWSIIRRIKQLLDLNWNVRISHTCREANRCADVLANMWCIAQHGLHVFDIPPPKVVSVLDNDLRGVSLPRIVSS
ncbi:ribonuclease H [Trifolium pratense]|uniref:Ribonuclease H n=1 Tax=Trifolium pratense TaxID=57577 RepID=A0A2K3PRS3_TRIPR|nr:ribonuclease H [Trifolium pratense]